MRSVARRLRVTLSTVQRWVLRAQGQRLDRVDWGNQPRGCRHSAWKTSDAIEDWVVRLRQELKEKSALGEYGAAAIQREFLEGFGKGKGRPMQVPSVRTIGRILARRGLLDSRRRVRRPAPPRGWFLDEVAAGRAELDSFDLVEDLVIEGGTDVNVLNGISLHGGLCASWPRTQITAKFTVEALVEHWQTFGLPGYAKFDNDTVFQGAHQWPDIFGRVIRVCLSLGVIPVFAPPQETGFQADMESYNGRWKAKVWQRFHFRDLAQLVQQSQAFVSACHRRSAPRIEAAPGRRCFPKDWSLDLHAPLRGLVIFLRRTDERGRVHVLGHTFEASELWCHRLVRAEVDLTKEEIRFFALRRRDPTRQPLLSRHNYCPPRKVFHE
jgi:hypothetical protein